MTEYFQDGKKEVNIELHTRLGNNKDAGGKQEMKRLYPVRLSILPGIFCLFLVLETNLLVESCASRMKEKRHIGRKEQILF